MNKVCSKTVMDTTDPRIVFDENGISDYYHHFNNVIKPNWKTNDEGLESLLSVSEKIKRKYCFEMTILNHVNSYLSGQSIVVSEDVEDTIAIKLGIDKAGKISILNIKSKPETLLVIPEIDSLLYGSINILPKIFPAVKRGQQVNTEFVLPVVVSIK